MKNEIDHHHPHLSTNGEVSVIVNIRIYIGRFTTYA